MVLVTIAVALCLVAMAYSEKLTDMLGGTGVTMEYESKLFDTDEVMSVDIQMDEEEWEKMLSNALSEEYYTCDVVINGLTVKKVAIRPKGNTSLSSIANNPDTDRYSIKLEFDHFVDGQTCYGLDKLILNNNFADATNMKEAIIYDMFQYLDVDASLYNYAEVSVNGEYWGVYLALEGVEDSFMLRNYGTQDGELYKPESMGMGGGKDGSSKSGDKGSFSPDNMPDMGDFDPSNMPEGGDFDPSNMPEGGDFDPSNMPEGGDFDPSNMPKTADSDTTDKPDGDSDSSGSGSSDRAAKGGFNPMGMGGLSMGGNGANLNYTDDDLDSYSTIWNGAISETSKADRRRVVTALKNISEGTDIEKYMDVDNILKYMAVHTFSVNMDSLSGSMAHNYYLYEYDGQLNILPWDYNLSLGGMNMGGGSASDMINDAIDTPFNGTDFFDALLENEEYLEKYHEYLRILAEEYVGGGRFDEVYNRIRSQIDDLVKNDPTAFFEYDEYTAGADMLYKTVILRAKSIEGQLDGSIPSTDEGQRTDDSTLIDASEIDASVMGTFNNGNGGDDAGPDNLGRGRNRFGLRGTDSDKNTPKTDGGFTDNNT